MGFELFKDGAMTWSKGSGGGGVQQSHIQTDEHFIKKFAALHSIRALCGFGMNTAVANSGEINMVNLH